MEELRWLIARATATRAARAEKSRAFGEIVRRFQDLAFGCAYAILGDFQLAEDAAQEAFITAWRNLDQLRKPEAFPGWFKRIVVTQCHRFTRNKQVETVSLDTLFDLPSEQRDLQEIAEKEELRAYVTRAIQTLPENERMVTTLFYINEYSYNDIAAFLEAPVTTIKKRLYCARQRLRESMLELVRETLQAKRPSNDEQFVSMVALFNEALESFVGKIKQDRNILAAILFGSLSHDTVWRKSDIDIILIGRDEKRPARDLALVENGINIHAMLVPRSKFRQMLEGGLQGSFFHSSFSKSTLLYSTDDSIQDYYRNVHHVGIKDRERQMLRVAQMVLITLAKAEKWFYVKQDLSYSFLWIMYTVTHLAEMEVVQHGEVISREVIHQALKVNPTFFNALYFELIHGKKDDAAIQKALDAINAYLDERIDLVFRPVLDYLTEAGGIRTTTDLDAYFKKQVQVSSLSMVYEWLADKGILQKAPSPLRLTPKSLIDVDEAAYYYDAEGRNPNF